MLLMLERFDCMKKELAMILDEAPYHDFQSYTSCGEPWRPNGPLVKAAMSIDLQGYAWLYVAYISDRASTWGSKQIKVVCGGTILRKELASSGAWTGNMMELTFETVAPEVFRNIIGERTDSTYRIISAARLQGDPSEVKLDEKGDELLGQREEVVKRQDDQPVRFGPGPKLGCAITLVTETGYSEKWWIRKFDDYKNERWWLRGVGDCRFGLTEIQRRPYVQMLMARLGFVKAPLEEGNGDTVIGLDEICSGHLRNVASSMDAIMKSERQKVYGRSYKKRRRVGDSGRYSEMGAEDGREMGDPLKDEEEVERFLE